MADQSKRTANCKITSSLKNGWAATDQTKRIAASLMLLCAGAIWGGGFVVMKNALESMPTNYLLALRFSIGAIGLVYFLFSKKRPLNRKTILRGLMLGVLLYSAFAAQTYGLMFTTAGNNALLTAFYVVIVPFLIWGLKKRRPERRIFFAAGLMLLGIGLLSIQYNFSINIGDLLTLLCAILYAGHIVCVDRFSGDSDIMQLTCLQLAFAAVLAWIFGLCFEKFPAHFSPQMLSELAYCGIGATLIALTIMNVGIKYAAPEYASLFMSTEAGFGCLFGVIFLGETLSGRMWAGCALILLALVVSQVDVDRIARHKERERV